MSKQRLVDTCFWDDGYVATLDPSEKLVFLYLLTNPLTNICGVYEVTLRRIGFDTGFDVETVTRILGRFERDGRCVYRDGWVALRNWIKHQRWKHPRVAPAIWRRLSRVPEDLREYVLGAVPNFTKPSRADEERWATYALALQDPRWQKRRQEILRRDGHQCQACGQKKPSLHIHHLRYWPNREPWDYADTDLVALCAACHGMTRAERGGTSEYN